MKKLLHLLARLEIELSHLEPLIVALDKEIQQINKAEDIKNERQLTLF